MYLPKNDGQGGNPVCYVLIRKFDPEQDVLVYTHVVVVDVAAAKVGGGGGDDNRQSYFMIGILSNDDIRARATLGTIFDIPPVFHRRSEVRLVEKRWRDDVEAMARFSANVYSVLAIDHEPDGKLFTLNVPSSPDVFVNIKGNISVWW